ncbi:helix-turn-helix transcriptional regulator [Pseudarthrobacter scleromae]|uniref:helix-turn-helix transcriptional regulator n=1 Tax=Pseudarthrobacter scleromae TaxID=158897 RepID=UPI00362A969C
MTYKNEDTDTTIWLTRQEAAEHMRLSSATLANWASQDIGPNYIRIGRGRVLYRRDDVNNWVEHQTKKVA